MCLLKKSLYGLCQAGRTCHATLDKSLTKLGATPTNADPCVYQLGKDKDLILIAIYVDNIIEFSRSGNAILLHQSGYVRDVLDRFGMTESNAVKTPMDSDVKLLKPDKDSASETMDSDWASCPNDRRSYTGFATILSSGPVSWEYKKQRTSALFDRSRVHGAC